MVNGNFLLDFFNLSAFYIKHFTTKAVAVIKYQLKECETHVKPLIHMQIDLLENCHRLTFVEKYNKTYFTENLNFIVHIIGISQERSVIYMITYI